MEVFQAFGQGLMSGTDAWKSSVSDHVIFTGPVDQVKGIEAFSKLNEGFMPMIRGNEIKQIVETGDFVITQMLMEVAMPSGKTITLDMNEWYEIKNEKIQTIKIYYDAEAFRKEMLRNTKS